MTDRVVPHLESFISYAKRNNALNVKVPVIFPACLVIVYVKDPGSRRLLEKKLFNDGIYCVTSQPELKVLHKNDRFLSIYDTFNEFQRERVAQIIEANIQVDVSGVHSTPKRMSKSLHTVH